MKFDCTILSYDKKSSKYYRHKCSKKGEGGGPGLSTCIIFLIFFFIKPLIVPVQFTTSCTMFYEAQQWLVNHKDLKATHVDK